MNLLTIQEYGEQVILHVGRESSQDLIRKTNRLNRRYKSQLGLRIEPFQIDRVDNQELTLRARGVTGQIRIGNNDVMIIPKYLTPASSEAWAKSLLIMLNISRTGAYAPHDLVTGTEGSTNFFDLLAWYYADSLENAIEKGLPIGYVKKDVDSYFFRGRLSVRRECMNIFTKPHLIACNITTMNNNIPLTRLLKWACSFLHVNIQSQITLERLRRLLGAFEGVSNLPPPIGQIEKVQLAGPQLQYSKPFSIALWLARQSGQLFFPESAEIPGVLVKSEKVFQDFISRCLDKVSARNPNWSHIRQRKFVLAVSGKGSIRTQPDDLIFVNEALTIVMDSKYKGDSNISRPEPNNEDMYQMIASCRACSCDKGILVYPSFPSSNAMEWKVKGGGSPSRIFTLGVDPTQLAHKDGMVRLLDHLQTNVEHVLSA